MGHEQAKVLQSDTVSLFEQEVKPSEETEYTGHLVASVAELSAAHLKRTQTFVKREDIGLLVTARHENRLDEHLGGQ